MSPPSHADVLAARLARRRAEGLYRTRTVVDSAQGVELRIGSEQLLSFCSNDYLGLAADPRLIGAFRSAADLYGIGSGASHLLTGHQTPHHLLEEELAAFVGAERALLFSTGYMANLGVLSALSVRHSTVFEDKLNHASLIDAARQQAQSVKRYPHLDTDRLALLLCESTSDKLILTDGVFSMDGDLAPLPALLALAREHDAWLLLDDAHGFGVLGTNGSGSIEHWAVPAGEHLIIMGTLGKAFGTFGAFVAGDETLIETLIQEARTYIYTTALPASVAEATRASLRIVQSETWRRRHLQDLVARFRAGVQELGLHLLSSSTPIQPIIFGESEKALAASAHLRAEGILVSAIRPPTVPANSARLRITLSAAHTPAHVDRLLEALDTLPHHVAAR